MTGMTIQKAAAACGGLLSAPGETDRMLGTVRIDSRAVCPGDLFVAYKGEKVDGHDYIAAAFDRGAACCLAERLPEGETRPCILVEDVQRALEQITAAYRQTLKMPIVGITGSVGKTSAKEMISAVLEQQFRTLKTEGNLNNQIGVPMTLSRIGPEHGAAVVEMGISDFGEMRRLTRMVRPTIGVFTVIGHAHLEFLHDLDGVLRAKTEMLEGMAEDAVIFVNGDDEKLRDFTCKQRKVCFGLGERCQIRAVDVQEDEKGWHRCTICTGERRIPVEIRAYGQHLLYAALAGAAVGLHLGLSDEQIARGILQFQAVGRRAEISNTGFLTLIDDSYNANPDSVKCGIDSLRLLPGRHVCLLGDMLEMGPDSPALHREVGLYAQQQGMDAVYTCGPASACTVEGAGAIGRHFDSKEALIEALPELLRQGDAVLVKASLGSGFGVVAEAVRNLGTQP